MSVAPVTTSLASLNRTVNCVEERERQPDVLQLHPLALLNVLLDLTLTGGLPHRPEDVGRPLVSPDRLQHVLGAVEGGQDDEVLLLHAEDVLLQSVQHQDPHSGQSQQDAGKDAAEYVEDDEGGDGDTGHLHLLHRVQPEGSDGEECEATVDLLAGEGVSRVQGEGEERQEEEEGGDPDDDLQDGEDPDWGEGVAVRSQRAGDVGAARLVADRATGHTAPQTCWLVRGRRGGISHLRIISARATIISSEREDLRM